MNKKTYRNKLSAIPKGQYFGTPITSRDRIYERINHIAKLNNETDGHMDEKYISWIRQQAYKALYLHVETMHDVEEILPTHVPRSGRYRLSFPYRNKDGQLRVRKIALGEFGVREFGRELRLTQNPNLGKFFTQFDITYRDFDRVIGDYEFVVPLTKAERLERVDTAPIELQIMWNSNRDFANQVGLTEDGRILIYDIQSEGSRKMWNALEEYRISGTYHI